MNERLQRYRERVPKGGRPLIIGHRGLNTVATENTLAAIEAAARMGADGVEIDVRPCKTGELVVFHDEDLIRLTDDTRKVAQLSLDEIRGLEIDIPVLSDALALCLERDLLLNVEVKHRISAKALKKAVGVLNDFDARLPLIVSSFDPRVVKVFRIFSDVPCAQLITPDNRWTGAFLKPFPSTAVHPSHELVSIESVREWQRHGYRVMTWTVNDQPTFDRMVEAGVNGIITDDPSRFVDVAPAVDE